MQDYAPCLYNLPKAAERFVPVRCLPQTSFINKSNAEMGYIMLKMPSVFSDSMVLQRNKNIAVWGQSDSSIVTASIGEYSVQTETNDGKWSLLLPPMEAGGPYELVVKSGGDTIVYKDVMLGEVWLAGGQSNMEFELQNCKGGSAIVENASGDNVRFYYTPKVAWVGKELEEAEAKSAWTRFTPGTCKNWSAAGYFFARELSERLGVTVGIIGCNWGGTSASCWISREFLSQDTRIKSYLEEYDNAVKDQDEEEYLKEREEYLAYQAEFDKNVAKYYETSPAPSWEEAISLFGENKYPGPAGPRNETRPCGLYEAMLERVMPYSIAGFLYYQGEEDDHKPYTYYELLMALVRQWRHDWKDDTLPFILVQLPVFANAGEPDYQNWPFIREAQMRLFETVKNTGIAVILETGEYNNIHPVDKEPVGKRLMLQAMYHVYGGVDESEAFGPVYKSYYIEEDRMHIKFQYAKEGLVCRTGCVEGFEIAGSNKKYYQADAVIDGDSVILSSDKVKQPLYARYCWTNYREVGLYGANGIPAAPFRTSMEDGAVFTGSRNTGLINCVATR